MHGKASQMTPESPRITPQALKMAWKMVETIFDRFQVSPRDRNALLHSVSLLSVQDLLAEKSAAWADDPAGAMLAFDGKRVRVARNADNALALRRRLGDRRIEQAYDRCEALLDRLEIPELERATLYTALPCLGLAALQESGLLKWKKPPPFPELG